MQSIKVKLGEMEYEVKELTIGQLEAIQDALFANTADGGRKSSTNREIIAAALSVDHKDAVQALQTARAGTIKQLVAAAQAVLTFGGFVEPEKASGEAQASG